MVAVALRCNTRGQNHSYWGTGFLLGLDGEIGANVGFNLSAPTLRNLCQTLTPRNRVTTCEHISVPLTQTPFMHCHATFLHLHAFGRLLWYGQCCLSSNTLQPLGNLRDRLNRGDVILLQLGALVFRLDDYRAMYRCEVGRERQGRQ